MPKLFQFDGTNLYCDGVPANTPDEIISHYYKNNLKDRPLIIYGAGELGNWYFKEMKRLQIPIAAVCDTHKAGESLPNGMGKIQSLSEALEKYPSAFIIIASFSFYDEIKSSILSDLPEERIFSLHDLLLTYRPMSVGSAYRNYLIEHLDAFNWLADNLADDLSRKTFREVILGRINGDITCFRRITQPDEYFPSDLIQLQKDEVFVDVGSYNGDTIQVFLEKSNRNFKKIFGFEPNKEQFDQIHKIHADLVAQGRLVLFQKCLWNCAETLYLVENGAGSYLTTETDQKDFVVEATALDDFILEPVSFIKMDIEGSELKALEGSKNLICKYRPVLAICVYHKKEDFVEIPHYIHNLGLEYRYYLRHHSDYVDQTVFYAVPIERLKHI